MKTSLFKSIFIFAFLGLTTFLNAQALIVKAQLRCASDKPDTGCYTLSNSYELMSVGKCSDLTLKLGYHDCFTLTFSKPGFRSKQVIISTFGSHIRRRRISLSITLDPLKASDMPEPDMLAGRIYFDEALSDYNYLNLCETQKSKAERKSWHKKYQLL